LANFSTKEDLLRRVFEESESTVNEEKIRPLPEIEVPEGKLEIPEFFNDVMPLDEVVCVDYYLPGCPPQTERLVEVFMAIATGKELPSKKSVVGAYDKSQCDECERKKQIIRRLRSFTVRMKFRMMAKHVSSNKELFAWDQPQGEDVELDVSKAMHLAGVVMDHHRM